MNYKESFELGEIMANIQWDLGSLCVIKPKNKYSNNEIGFMVGWNSVIEEKLENN